MRGSIIIGMKKLSVFINVGLIALTILAAVKCCLISFDIDEAYAITQSYRFAIGDHMFSEMWEPHQMSSFGATLFMLPFLWITGGSTTGIVLYLRIVGTLIHLLLGMWLFLAAKRRMGSTGALLTALAHVNFLPKWIVMPEFEIMQYWSVCVLFICILQWQEKNACRMQSEILGKIRREDMYLFVGGIAMFVSLLTYPTMILLYPVYALAFYKLNTGSKREKWRGVTCFTVPALVLGICYLAYLGSYMSISEFVKNIGFVFMDDSHSVGLGVRMSGYGKELLAFLEMLGIPVLIGCVLAVFLKKTGVCCRKSWKESVLFGLLSVTLILCVIHMWDSVFADKNQFYMYFRYLWIVIIGLTAYKLFRKDNSVYLYAGIIPGLVGVLASMLVTNMTLEIALARVYIGVIATIFLLKDAVYEQVGTEKCLKALSYVTMLVFLSGLLVSKLILVRFTGCIPATIKAPFEQVADGPAKGILVREEIAWQFNDNYRVMNESLKSGDKLLYFGCENLYYLFVEGIIFATPSVQGTTVFDEVFLRYYEEHPERMPNVVIIDKLFPQNPYYRYSEKNIILEEWIAEEFADAEVTESDCFIILRKDF